MAVLPHPDSLPLGEGESSAAFRHVFDLADAVAPEDLQLATARFVHELLDEIDALAKPLFHQRVSDRRFDLARIRGVQRRAADVPLDAMDLVARRVHLRKKSRHDNARSWPRHSGAASSSSTWDQRRRIAPRCAACVAASRHDGLLAVPPPEATSCPIPRRRSFGEKFGGSWRVRIRDCRPACSNSDYCKEMALAPARPETEETTGQFRSARRWAGHPSRSLESVCLGGRGLQTVGRCPIRENTWPSNPVG